MPLNCNGPVRSGWTALPPIFPCSDSFFSQFFNKRASYVAIPENITKGTNHFSPRGINKAFSRRTHAVSSNKTCSFSSDMFLAREDEGLVRMLAKKKKKVKWECRRSKGSSLNYCKHEENKKNFGMETLSTGIMDKPWEGETFSAQSLKLMQGKLCHKLQKNVDKSAGKVTWDHGLNIKGGYAKIDITK